VRTPLLAGPARSALEAHLVVLDTRPRGCLGYFGLGGSQCLDRVKPGRSAHGSTVAHGSAKQSSRRIAGAMELQGGRLSMLDGEALRVRVSGVAHLKGGGAYADAPSASATRSHP
jgi:hypothetical protein